jgi:bla regulator protein BlaR1
MTLFTMSAFSTSPWAAIWAPLANHLWQSTLFAGVAGLLTLLLRKNRAQTRYSLWLIASVKFLLPFSLLIGMGSHLRWSNGPAIAQPSLFSVTQVISEPFAAVNPGPVTAHSAGSPLASIVRALPVLLLTAWLCGCVAAIFFWWRRRQRVTAAMRRASPVQAGRELEILLRLQQSAGMAGQIELKLSESMLEPGILGILRPVLLLPAGIADRLTDAQLQAIIAHELCHVRRRDNLAAAVHMLVEALFWFHPLVWWIGARLVDERERACDEDVLRLGSDPQAYAEGILKVCEFYLESPLLCAAGVTGSNLKKRIEAIMVHRTARNIELGKKLLLAATGVLAVVGPLAFGLLHATQSRAELWASNTSVTPAFEVVSVQPSHTEHEGNTVRFAPGTLTLANWTIGSLIVYAYGSGRVLGGPSWINSERYDIDVKVDDSLAYKAGRLIETNMAGQFPPGLRHEQLMLLIQSLLADRFKLRFSRETKQLPVYALVIAKDGPKLHEAKSGDTYPDGIVGPDGLPAGPHRGAGQIGHFTAQAIPMSTVTQVLSEELHRTVLDETGLTGEYDFTLEWTPDETHDATDGQQRTDNHPEHESSGPSIFTALEEQLGLRLESKESPAEFLVIDHVEQVADEELSPSKSQAQNIPASAPGFASVSIRPNKTGEPMAGFNIKGRPMRAMQFKPDRFMATNVTLHGLIVVAYGVQGSQVSGGPDWLGSENFDVEAKMDKSVMDALQEVSPEQRLLGQERMLQALLADRFKLTLHHETKEVPAYVLVIAKDGAKLKEAKPGDTYPDGFKDPNGRPLGAGALLQPGPCKLVGQGVPIADLAKTLSMNDLHQPVVDQTGLAGVYDFTLDCHTAFRERGESMLTILPEQLGLELKPQTVPVEMLVIDHAEKAAADELGAGRIN